MVHHDLVEQPAVEDVVMDVLNAVATDVDHVMGVN